MKDMDHIKVENHPHLVRDKNSNAILNRDVVSLNKYKEERDQKKRILSMLDEHQKLKDDVSEIKAMLRTLLGKNDK